MCAQKGNQDSRDKYIPLSLGLALRGLHLGHRDVQALPHSRWAPGGCHTEVDSLQWTHDGEHGVIFVNEVF